MPDDSRGNTAEYQIFKEGNLTYDYNTSMHNKSLISQIPGDVFCVGFGLLPDYSLSHWIPIPCQMPYMASFFCASNVNLNNKIGNNDTTKHMIPLEFDKTNSHQFQNITTRGMTSLICPFGWIMINDSCFYMYTVSSRVTFIEAEEICRAAQARIPTISKTDLGHSKSYEASNSTIFTPSKSLVLKVLDQMTDALSPILTSKLNSFQTKYKEMMVGIRLIATQENMNLALLLQMIGNILKFRSNILIRGPRQQCFILDFDTDLSNMLPDLHTEYGNSISGWIMIEQKCFEKYYVLPLVCTKKAISTLMACGENHYKCSDDSCILLIYRCDGFNDCIFSEDELECLPDIHPMVPCFSFHGDNAEIMIPFHSLCDGISHCPHGTDESFCLYNQMVYDMQKSEPRTGIAGYNKQARHKQQKLLEKPSVATMETGVVKYIVNIFMERLKNNKLYPGPPHHTYNTELNYKLWPFYFQCSFSDDTFLFENLCKHKQNGGTICGMGTHLQYCKYVKCSGMFKCSNSFCIEIGDVCDGKQDCVDGEDEMFCDNLSCPGMLRCRGETRCVPPWSLCDGHAECQFTFDDETSCSRCLKHCECDGRSLLCQTEVEAEQHALYKFIKTPNSTIIKDNIKQTILHMDTIYMTATHLQLKSKGKIRCLNYNILNPNFSLVIKLDISYCRLKHIDNIMVVTNHKQIAFLNASHNRLFSSNILTIFSELPLHHLDISYNEFAYIETPDSNLIYLQLLKLANNKITHLRAQFIGMASNVRWLDLRHNPIQYVSLRLVRTLKYLYILDVTDIEICCIFSSVVKCDVFLDVAKHTVNIQFCKAYIANFSLKICSQFILIVCVLINLTSIILNVLHVQVKRTKLPVTYLNINISLTGLISICYVISVFLVDNTIERQPIAYVKNATTNTSCIFKQIFCLIMLQMDVYLIIIKSYSILSRIKYPFQHQCQWIKFINLICIVYWIIATGISAIVVYLHYSTSDIISFLKNCHILAESKNNTLGVKIVSLAHSIFYLVILMTYIYIMITLYVTVRQSMSMVKKSSSMNKRYIMANAIIMTSIEIFLVLAVSVTTFVPCVFLFTRNLYVHFYIFVILIKTFSKDILHSLHPTLARFNKQ